VSLVSDGFSCSGAGITIRGSPSGTQPDDVIETFTVMEAMCSSRPLPQRLLTQAWTAHK
jgi:hypothetical protein